MRRTSHIQKNRRAPAGIHLGGGSWHKIIHMVPTTQRSIEEFERSLNTIVASARTSPLPVVIGGDFIAWETEWGSKKTNYLGYALLKASVILELETKIVRWAPATFDRETFLCSVEGAAEVRKKASHEPLQRHAMLQCPR